MTPQLITSRLQPLIPDEMRSGQRLCSADGLQELKFIAGPDSLGRVVASLNQVFVFEDPANLRLAPLGWIEQTPVYALDRLFNKMDGRLYTVTGDAGHDTFRTNEARADGAYALGHEDASWGIEVKGLFFALPHSRKFELHPVDGGPAIIGRIADEFAVDQIQQFNGSGSPVMATIIGEPSVLTAIAAA